MLVTVESFDHFKWVVPQSHSQNSSVCRTITVFIVQCYGIENEGQGCLITKMTYYMKKKKQMRGCNVEKLVDWFPIFGFFSWFFCRSLTYSKTGKQTLVSKILWRICLRKCKEWLHGFIANCIPETRWPTYLLNKMNLWFLALQTLGLCSVHVPRKATIIHINTNVDTWSKNEANSRPRQW